MQFTHTHHMALLTAHFDRLRQFYVETLGCEIVGAFPGHNIVFIAVGSTTIELVENLKLSGVPGEGGWAHLALEVPDVDAAFATLSAQGVPFHVTPKDFPDAAPSVRIAFFKDPDGNILELVQPLGARYPQR